MWTSDVVCLCILEGDRGPMPQRGPYQRAMSVDSKLMGGIEAGGGGGGAGGLAGRRHVPCPTLVKQENMEAPIRSGPVPNGFPGGIGVCPPRGNPTSNDNNVVSLCLSFCFPLPTHGSLLPPVLQEPWAEEQEWPNVLPCRGQATGACRGPPAARGPDQDTLEWAALAPCRGRW